MEEEAKYRDTPLFGRILTKTLNYFHLALSFFAVAREKVDSKYKRRAIRYAVKCRELISGGQAPFLHGMRTLLAAEEELLKSKTVKHTDELLTMYTKAYDRFEEGG